MRMRLFLTNTQWLVTIPGDDHCYDRHLDQVTKAIREFMTEEMVR